MKHPPASIICQSLNDRVAHFFDQSCSRLLRYLRVTTQYGCRLDKREQYKRKQRQIAAFSTSVRFVTRSAGHFCARSRAIPLPSDIWQIPLWHFVVIFISIPNKSPTFPPKKTSPRCYRRIFTASLVLPSCFPATKKDEIFLISFREYENFSWTVFCFFFFFFYTDSYKLERRNARFGRSSTLIQ